MSLWRMEWLRLLRTHRLLALLGVYLFFGLTGPLTARYLNEILGRFAAGEVKVQFREPTPADGISQFTGNAAQIGLLVVVMVAAAALAFDSRREMAVFLRSRVGRVRRIILPAYAMSTAAAVTALIAGSLAAWYETAVLLGPVPASTMLLGMLLGAVFLAFAVALVGLVASMAKGTLATAGISLAVLLGLAIAGNLGGRGLGRRLPTTLVGAMADLVLGARPADYLPAAAVAVLATVGCLWAAITLSERREL
jgi:ABC-2 type transport system permease protein